MSAETELLASKKPVTQGFLAKLMKRVSPQIGDVVKERIAAAVAPALQRLATLEYRVSALSIVLTKGQPQLGQRLDAVAEVFERLDRLEAAMAKTAKGARWCDVWTERTYELGDMVTMRGALWHCQVSSTTAKPGESRDWKLMTKSR